MEESRMTEAILALWVTEDETRHVWSNRYNLAALKAVASCIPLIHETAPDSWSLLGTGKGP